MYGNGVIEQMRLQYLPELISFHRAMKCVGNDVPGGNDVPWWVRWLHGHL